VGRGTNKYFAMRACGSGGSSFQAAVWKVDVAVKKTSNLFAFPACSHEPVSPHSCLPSLCWLVTEHVRHRSEIVVTAGEHLVHAHPFTDFTRARGNGRTGVKLGGKRGGACSPLLSLCSKPSLLHLHRPACVISTQKSFAACSLSLSLSLSLFYFRESGPLPCVGVHGTRPPATHGTRRRSYVPGECVSSNFHEET
jgi:hypothetical protein